MKESKNTAVGTLLPWFASEGKREHHAYALQDWVALLYGSTGACYGGGSGTPAKNLRLLARGASSTPHPELTLDEYVGEPRRKNNKFQVAGAKRTLFCATKKKCYAVNPTFSPLKALPGMFKAPVVLRVCIHCLAHTTVRGRYRSKLISLQISQQQRTDLFRFRFHSSNKRLHRGQSVATHEYDPCWYLTRCPIKSAVGAHPGCII